MSRSEPLQTRSLMRPYALAYLYRRRLRAHAAQECFAGLGIAIAVALVFATLVAEGSIAGSASQVVHTVVGPANLQLRARSASGFDERLLAPVEHLPGVKQAAPLLEQTATLRGAQGRFTAVTVAGTDTSLAVLDGLAETLPLATLSPGAIGLSRATAEAIGIPAHPRRGASVTLQLRGRAVRLRVSAVLGPEAVGALSRARVAVMSLESMQRLAGLRGRVTHILIESEPGRKAAVRGELQRLAAGKLTVEAADAEVAQLHQALRPSALASGLFGAVGGLLGFLLAFNAMLVTVPERRQAIADLRMAGTRRATIVQIALFQAVCLGLAASLIGLLAGYALSVGALHQPSGYLAEEFTLGGSTVLSAQTVLLALVGGVAATCLASMVPLLDLRRGRARDAVYRQDGVAGDALGHPVQRRLFAAALVLIVAASVLFALVPAAAIAATALLALATVLTVPLVLGGVLALMRIVTNRYEKLIVLPIALASLRTTTLRSLALAATGAVALFGAVALGGARGDLLQQIKQVAHDYAAEADIWVTSPGDNQATVEFLPDRHAARIAQNPGVAGVRVFQGSFLDINGARPWIIARPPGSSAQIFAGQIIDGRANVAAARLSEGGWVAVSKQIADEQHSGVGGTLSIPTPTGIARLRIAATTTNFAWLTGVIFMSTTDYSRLWPSSTPTALGIEVAKGVSPARVEGELARQLADSGLEVSSQLARQGKIEASAREGLGQLQEISTLLEIAAIFAMVAALTSAIWQRRTSLAGLRLSGGRPARLRRILFVESALMLSAGCLTGAVAGIYGQAVVDGDLRRVTGFPVASAAVSARPLEVFALVVAVALAIMTIPGWFASRVSPGLALEND